MLDWTTIPEWLYFNILQDPRCPLRARIAAAWESAEERFARLDQVVTDSDLRDAWMGRAHFEEAAAALWLEGKLVPLENLVLFDAKTAVRLPTQELFQARSVLLSRRSLARQEPDESLSLPGILALKERRERLSEPDHGALILDHDPDWDTRSRIVSWLDLARSSTGSLPCPRRRSRSTPGQLWSRSSTATEP